jgi:hypothetical protein
MRIEGGREERASSLVVTDEGNSWHEEWAVVSS